MIIHTQKHTVHRGTKGTCFHKFSGALGNTVTGVLANAFKPNINLTNKNTTIKAEFCFKRLNFIENFFTFLKISQDFLVFLKTILKVIKSISNFPTF